MFLRLGTGQHSKRKGKVVVLSHDIAFRPNTMAVGGTDDALELDIFLKEATQSGYQFKTIDTYPFD